VSDQTAGIKAPSRCEHLENAHGMEPTSLRPIGSQGGLAKAYHHMAVACHWPRVAPTKGPAAPGQLQETSRKAGLAAHWETQQPVLPTAQRGQARKVPTPPNPTPAAGRVRQKRKGPALTHRASHIADATSLSPPCDSRTTVRRPATQERPGVLKTPGRVKLLSRQNRLLSAVGPAITTWASQESSTG
jgi:hypothetical protein